METFKLITILITVILAAIGWIIAHYFTSKRDLENKKREIRINLSIEVFKAISLWMTEPKAGDSLKGLANALILVQFFGNESQINIAKDALKSMEKPNTVENLGDLISSLRDDFRKVIGLNEIDGNVNIVTKRA